MNEQFALSRDHLRVVLRALREYSGSPSASGAGLSEELQAHDEALSVLSYANLDGSTSAGRGVDIGYRVAQAGPLHLQVRVYVGRTPGSRGYAGDLWMRADELEALKVAGWKDLGE